MKEDLLQGVRKTRVLNNEIRVGLSSTHACGVGGDLSEREREGVHEEKQSSDTLIIL